jgi:hypothetical protein
MWSNHIQHPAHTMLFSGSGWLLLESEKKLSGLKMANSEK